MLVRISRLLFPPETPELTLSAALLQSLGSVACSATLMSLTCSVLVLDKIEGFALISEPSASLHCLCCLLSSATSNAVFV